ncbi:MAG: SUMF1/EgtB/PvdO family nonheme iron enzyme [Candidatus Eisenbacteria bacterium]|nr:SUMF1/EgtB/PvdO family nonheme iron enzyme [Candidatus Eisenbacteria bacterium]
MLRTSSGPGWVLLAAIATLLQCCPGCSESTSPGSGDPEPPGRVVPGRLSEEALPAADWGTLYAHTTLGSSPLAADGSFSARFDSTAVRAVLLIALEDGTPVLGARASMAAETIRVGPPETAELLAGLDPLLWGIPAALREAALAGLGDQLDPVAGQIGDRLGGEDEQYLVRGQDLTIQTALAQLLRGERSGFGDPTTREGSGVDSLRPYPAPGSGGEASPVIVNPQTCYYAYAIGDYYGDEWTTVAPVSPAEVSDPLQIPTPARTPLDFADGRYEVQLHGGRLGCGADLGDGAPGSADGMARDANLGRACGSLLRDVYLAIPELSWFDDPASFSSDSLADLAALCAAWQGADSLALYREVLGAVGDSHERLASDVPADLLTMLEALADAMAAATAGQSPGRFAGDLATAADSLCFYIEISGADVRLLDPPTTLAAPAELTAALGDSAVLLEWEDRANNEEGYVVQRTRYGGFSDLTTLPTDAESYADSSVVGGSTYRYRVRAYHQQMRSEASNEVEIEIPAPDDLTAPRYLWDLSAELVGSHRVELRWTTTGDDGNTGVASQYDLRYAHEPINDTTWLEATQVAGEPDPAAPGNVQTFRIDSLAFDTHYYFSMKVGDEVPNWSLLSNPAEVTTPAAPIELELLHVPAGSFTMGSDPGEGGGDEEPEHYPYLNGFWIDKYEVTNAMCAEALNWALAQGRIEIEPDEEYGNVRQPGGGEYYFRLDWDPAGGECRIMTEFGPFESEAGWDNHPVVNCTWYGAVAYCNWRSLREGLTPCYDLEDWSCNYAADGYRLPSEAEWEKAARGAEDERIYPWGTSGLSCALANRFGCVGHTAAVDDSFYIEGLSPYGGWHMAGNVTEWCNDWYDYDYYEESPPENPRGPDFAMHKVVRGGSWLTQQLPRVSYRKSYPPAHSWTSIGFRCVRRE